MSKRLGEDRPELDRLDARERSEVLRRERIVQEIDLLIFNGRRAGLKAADIIREYLVGLRSHGITVAFSTLGMWRAQYHKGGIAWLVDTRRLRGYTPDELEAKFPAFVELLAAHIRTAVAEGRGGVLGFYRASSEARRDGTAFPHRWRDAQAWACAFVAQLKRSSGADRGRRKRGSIDK